MNFLLRDPLLVDPKKTALAAGYATMVLAPCMTATIVARVTAWAGGTVAALRSLAESKELEGWDHDASEKDWAADFKDAYKEDPPADIEPLLEPPVMAPPLKAPSKKAAAARKSGGGGGGGEAGGA